MKHDNFGNLLLKFLNDDIFLWGLVIGSKHLASVLAQKFQCVLGQSVHDNISGSYCYKISPFQVSFGIIVVTSVSKNTAASIFIVRRGYHVLP